jgi:hypothetical protein
MKTNTQKSALVTASKNHVSHAANELRRFVSDKQSSALIRSCTDCVCTKWEKRLKFRGMLYKHTLLRQLFVIRTWFIDLRFRRLHAFKPTVRLMPPMLLLLATDPANSRPTIPLSTNAYFQSFSSAPLSLGATSKCRRPSCRRSKKWRLLCTVSPLKCRHHSYQTKLLP